MMFCANVFKQIKENKIYDIKYLRTETTGNLY